MSTHIEVSELKRAIEWAYQASIQGVDGQESAAELAESHHRVVQTSFEMADEIAQWQVERTTIANYFDVLAEQLQVPEDLPQPLTTFLYLQLRILAAIAYGGGRDDLRDPLVQALVFSSMLKNNQPQALQAGGLPTDFVATRSALKKVDPSAAASIREESLRRIAYDLQSGGPLALAQLSVEAPWRDPTLVPDLARVASRTFIVMHRW